jgi:hypothetical protein
MGTIHFDMEHPPENFPQLTNSNEASSSGDLTGTASKSSKTRGGGKAKDEVRSFIGRNKTKNLVAK